MLRKPQITQIAWRGLRAQPNDKSRNLLRLMSICLMSFAHVSRLTSLVKPRDGSAKTPLGASEKQSGLLFSGGRETWDMRREKARDDKTLDIGMDRKNLHIKTRK